MGELMDTGKGKNKLLSFKGLQYVDRRYSLGGYKKCIEDLKKQDLKHANIPVTSLIARVVMMIYRAY